MLTASVAFSALSLFNILARVLMIFPIIVRYDANGKVSTKRISKFLNAPEIQRTWLPSCDNQVLIQSSWLSSSKVKVWLLWVNIVFFPLAAK